MNYSLQKINTQKGFSLLELLLAVTITSVLLLTLVFFTQDILEVQVKQRSIREVTEQGERIMTNILDLVHNAESVTVPTGGGSGTTLELVYANTSQNPTEITLSGGTIFFEENNNGTIPLHNDFVTTSNLLFTDRTQTDAWDTVDVEFTLEYNSTSARNEYEYTKTWYGTAVIRNYVR